MNFRNIRIGQRLALGFGLVIAFLALLAALSAMRIQSLSHEITHLLEDAYPRSILAHRVKADVNEVSRSMLSILIMTDPAQVEEELGKIDKFTQSSEKWMGQLQASVTDEDGVKLMSDIDKIRKKTKKSQQLFTGLIKDNQKEDALTNFLFSIRPAHAKYFAQLDKLVALQESHMVATGKSSTQQATHTTYIIAFLAVAALLVSSLVAYFATRSITRPLIRAVEIAKRVANGDLTARIHSDSLDETGQLIKALAHMNQCLQQIVGNVRTSTDTIASASIEIASGNANLSVRTENQASSLQQTSGAMNDLTAIVRQNANNASQANQLAASATEVATAGGAVVTQVVETMGNINASSRKIVDIISVIDGIAFQTNILALNAAVEAARAGEQGRGFAVVAGEVRTLAQRSATAAKEIKSLINESVEKVAQGSELVTQAGSTMTHVVDSVRRVSDIIGEITAASQAQSDGIESVTMTISKMDDVTSQNAALVEQAAAAAESMQNQAQSLAQLVSVFRLKAEDSVDSTV
jgi:methyl-accepting chemotaxis protein